METETDSANLSTSRSVAGPAQLRVSADKVGRLMDLVGELSLSVSETIWNPDLAGLDLARFENSARRLQLVLREVQTAAAELRLVPIGEVFRRMRPLVRELERQTGKRVDLAFQGDDTEIDKLIVDRLFEPLVHLLRNSVDHGLESPQDRLAAGKAAAGSVLLSAAHVGGEVQITIADDGRGLHRGRILEKARSRGFVGPGEEPADSELWKVIFQPGFSTAENVTNLSGRGVGMDVLHHAIAQLRGRIDIRSEAGRGAAFTLSIPLSLAFLDCLVMRVDDILYAAPVESVSEVFRPGDERVMQISAQGGNACVQLRGASIPLRRLCGARADAAETALPHQTGIVVVANTSRGRVGLLVDEMFDQQQIVMKPLVGHLSKIRGGVGCALLGGGEVAIVLDCEKLIREFDT